MCVICSHKRFCNLDFQVTETRSVIHNGGKVNVNGQAESRPEQQQSDSTPVSCDGSILMLIISFTKKWKKKKKSLAFQRRNTQPKH